VTEETKNALTIINGLRTANNLNILDCYCLSLVGGTDANSKLSSSQLREAMHNKNKLSPEMYEYLKKHWMGLVVD
jgi:phosphopantetheine adenylyltransferase